MKRSLGAKVNLGWKVLVVVDITVKSSSFRVVSVYAPNNQ